MIDGNWKRFQRCRTCERNETIGFSGPPECDLALLPEPNGECSQYTTEVAEAPAVPAVTIRKETLVGALALLKPVAQRARFAGSQPIMVAVGPDSLELRAVDGETDVRIARGTVNGTAKRTVVPLEPFLAAIDTAELTLTVKDNGALDVGGTGVPGSQANTLPGPFEVGDAGALLTVPPLTENCTYLVRAVNKEETRPVLRYVLMELPAFTFVATDGKRLHVQWTLPEDARRPSETNVLLTKEQLGLLWGAPLLEKQLAATNKGCVVTGTLDDLAVDMAFTTGVGQFPDWRMLVAGYEETTSLEIEAVRKALREEGATFEVGNTVQILKEHLRDVIVGWVDDAVHFAYKNPAEPVVVSGSDRQAVVLWATDVEQPAVEEGSKMKEKKAKKVEAVQTSAPVAAGPAVKNFAIGQEVATPTGTVKVLKDRVAYLVQLPSGKKRWFSDAGLRQFVAGVAVEEGADEAAA